MANSQSESRLRGAEIPRFTQNKLRNLKRFAEGKQIMPGPGKRNIAFLHCQERKILSLRGVQRRSNLLIRGQPEMRQA
jgi:hypothetical protein